DLRFLSGVAANAADRRIDNFLWSNGGSRYRISLVQRSPGRSLHGRRGIARARRGDWHGGGHDQTGTAAAVHRGRVCHRGGVGDLAGGVVQTAQEKNLQDGANSSSL